MRKYRCDFCATGKYGDTLYELGGFNGGYTFSPVKNIRFCPLCGTMLQTVSLIDAERIKFIEEYEKNRC